MHLHRKTALQTSSPDVKQPIIPISQTLLETRKRESTSQLTVEAKYKHSTESNTRQGQYGKGKSQANRPHSRRCKATAQKCYALYGPAARKVRVSLWLGHIQESVTECISKWNNKSTPLSLSPSLSLKSINYLLKLNKKCYAMNAFLSQKERLFNIVKV